MPMHKNSRTSGPWLYTFQSCHMAFWSGIPLVVAFSSFATVAVVSSKPLTSDLIFPAISLFMLLQFPLEMVRYLSRGIVYYPFSLYFPQVSLVTSNIIEAVVSIKRLSSFLNSEELEMYRTVVETPMLQFGDEVSVMFFVGSVQLQAISSRYYRLKTPIFRGRKMGPRLPLKESILL